MLNENFVILGALLNFIGGGSYAFDTFRGKTQPNRVTFFLWALAPLIAFSAQLSGGIGLRSLMTFMVGLGPAIVFLVSFRDPKAYWKITKFDIICGVLSVLALVFWYLSKDVNIAIMLSILADLLAGVPTIIKAYKFPETESYNTFFFGAVSAAITLLTVKIWSFTVAAFPIYILIICIVIFIPIFKKQGIQLIKS